ncbi:MAG: hypothetical protein ACRD1E_03015 [Terriglobales bacterium]
MALAALLGSAIGAAVPMLFVALAFRPSARVVAAGYAGFFFSGLSLLPIIAGMRRRAADPHTWAWHIALQWYAFCFLLGAVTGVLSIALGVLTVGDVVKIYVPCFAAVDGVVCVFVFRDAGRRARNREFQSANRS